MMFKLVSNMAGSLGQPLARKHLYGLTSVCLAIGLAIVGVAARQHQAAFSSSVDRQEDLTGFVETSIPSLYLSTTNVHLGIMQHNHTANSSITIWNRGNRRLEINDIRTPCSCTVAKVDKNLINPGEKVELYICVTTSSMNSKEFLSYALLRIQGCRQLVKVRIDGELNSSLLDIIPCSINLSADAASQASANASQFREIFAIGDAGILNSIPDSIVLRNKEGMLTVVLSGSPSGELSQKRLLLEIAPSIANSDNSDAILHFTDKTGAQLATITVSSRRSWRS